MSNNQAPTLTKSDFLLYCEAPRHLWAKKHGLLTHTLSDFDQHLIDEGYVVEELAQAYLESHIVPLIPGGELHWQQTYSFARFEARADALIYKPQSGTYDLYEIKSATTPDKQDQIDVAFQAWVFSNLINIEHCYILHLNKGYTRIGDTDPGLLFIADDLTDNVTALLPGISKLGEQAYQSLQVEDYFSLPSCLNPKECPCPDLCHPDLPEFSIYDVPRLSAKAKTGLLEMGIRDGTQIPATVKLNEKQKRIVECACTGAEFLDYAALRCELNRFVFPLWFLDYETCICAVPRFSGYHPQQQVVFQYSLHRLDHPDGEWHHFGHISASTGDPSLPLLQKLSTDLGSTGTVIVWNKSFEMSRNTEMASIHPEFAPFLENLNARVYDLGEIINHGIYIHPAFKGSWSIKNVLPVMVPGLSYSELAINKGDKASMAWWHITFEQLDEKEKQAMLDGLEIYCELDTLAMIRIYERLREMA